MMNTRMTEMKMEVMMMMSPAIWRAASRLVVVEHPSLPAPALMSLYKNCIIAVYIELFFFKRLFLDR